MIPEPGRNAATLLSRAEEEQVVNPRLALELANQAWVLLDPDDVEGQLACRLCLGWSHSHLGSVGEAAVHFNDALDLATRNHQVSSEVRARTGLGSVYFLLGRLDTALVQLEGARRLAEGLDDQRDLIQVGIAVGEVYLALERPHEALDEFSRARQRAQNCPRQKGLAETLLALGKTFLSLKRHGEALEQLSRALILTKDQKSVVGEARCLGLIGEAYLASGELDIAEEYYHEALKLYQNLDHPWGQLEAYFHLGDLHALRGFRQVALRHFEKVTALARSLDAKTHLVRADLRIAELWERAGDPVRALEATRRALELERVLKADEVARNVRSLLDQYRAEQDRNHAEMLKLQSARLEAESLELKKALESLRVISELGRRITSRLTVSGLFQTLYQSLGQLFDLPAFGLALYDPADHSMRYVLRIENGQRIEPTGRKPADTTMAGWALTHRTTVLVADLFEEMAGFIPFEAAEEMKKVLTYRSAIFLPLVAGDTPVGVVTVQHPLAGVYDEVHSRFLETLGGYIVVALTNALSHRKVKRLNRQILRLAQYDPLTGLANRRLLADVLRRTVALAQRNRSRFALFFLDLDGFKPVNDQWGHGAGDHVLAQVGSRLASCLRDSDLVARVGGDEFVALALDVGDQDAIEAIAAKLSKAVTQPVEWNDASVSLGVSIGIAVYPETATEPDALLSRADSAMYSVKNTGKNRWAFAELTPGGP